MKYLVLLLYLSLCAFAGIILPAPAHAAEADNYWNCATIGAAPQWCSVTTTSPLPIYTPDSFKNLTAAGAVKSSSGFVHTISIAGVTASPTAGLLTVYDNTAASGTVIWQEWVPTSAVGHSIVIDAAFANGLYVGFDGTLANVSITVSYR